MNDLFCEDINMRAAKYADKHACRYDKNERLIWQAMANAYVEGAVSQHNIDKKYL